MGIQGGAAIFRGLSAGEMAIEGRAGLMAVQAPRPLGP